MLANVCFAQVKKDITVEDVWKNSTFRIKSVPGFNGMKDGKRYTQIDKDGDKQVINIYDLATGKKTATLFSNPDNYKIDDYSFSADEHKKRPGRHA